MNVFIWGAGVSGGRFLDFIGENRVIAFIDNNEVKQRTCFKGKSVISGKEYFDNYKGEPVIIAAMSASDKIIASLQENGVYNYYDMFDCPSLVFDFEKKYVFSLLDQKMIFNEDRAYIYGWNILIKLYLEERGEGNYHIIFQDMKQMQREEFISRNNILFVEHDPSVKINCISNQALYNEGVKKYGERVIDLFQPDYHRLIFHNIELERFRDSAEKDACVIVATGPSLTMADLDRLKEHDVDCFSVNGIYAAFNKTEWRPKYYVLLDTELAEECDARHMDAEYIFLSDNNDAVWSNAIPDNVYRIHPLIGSKEIWFSEDLSYGYGSAENVTYTCIQMAVYMGYKNIYLLGVDFSQGMKENADEHFSRNYFKSSVGSYATLTDMRSNVEKGYHVARRCAEQAGVHIYNVTRGGFLEVFERKNFDSVIEGL